MIIQCQACNTKFRVGDEKVKPPGIKVRCSKCGEVFFYEFSVNGDNNEISNDLIDQTAEIESGLVNEVDESPELSNEPASNSEEPALQAETVDQNDVTEQDEPKPGETDKTESSDENFSNIEVESIETIAQAGNEDDELTKLSKEIMAAQIGGADISQTAETSSENETVDDLPDELTQPGSEENEPLMEVVDNTPPQSTDGQSDFNPPTEPPDNRANEGPNIRNSSLVVDQDVLEQTYTKGTVLFRA